MSTDKIIKIGKGSIGGKARGIYFLQKLLRDKKFANTFAPHKILTPTTTVICTEVFEQFIAQNNLSECVFEENDDKVLRLFAKADFPSFAKDILKEFLDCNKDPIVVRSSSSNEDSFSKPFAGLYFTVFLPNNHKNPQVRLEQLLMAIKSVYASTYLQTPKKYMKRHKVQIENEQMGIVLQNLVGQKRGNIYYPYFSGVVQTHNFFPLGSVKSDDGLAQIALGLGCIIADGGNSVRFCPKFPTIRPDSFQIKDILQNRQKVFFALDLKKQPKKWQDFSKNNVQKYEIKEFEENEFSDLFFSTYNPQEGLLYDRFADEGILIPTFNQLLKNNSILPVVEILQFLLEKGKESLQTSVVLEYAIELAMDKNKPLLNFYLLQLRPQGVSTKAVSLQIEKVPRRRTIIRSYRTCGNGNYDKIEHIIYVMPDKFDPQKTVEIAKEIEILNEKLEKQNKQYLLVGPGRWGSSNTQLGIPVSFSHISQAKVIVEVGLKDFDIEPSQGTHFFHNITASNIGFLAVSEKKKEEQIKLSWFNKQPATTQLKYTKHIHLQKNLPSVVINGICGAGVMILSSERK